MKVLEQFTETNLPYPSSLRRRAWPLMVGLALLGFPALGTAGLVGYWQFEEGTGTTTADSSGNNLTGTLVNTPTWVTPGAVGSWALDFDPADRVLIGNDPLLQLTGPLTVAGWTFADTVSGSGRIITKGGNSGSRGWSLGVESAGYYSFQIPSSGTSLTSVNTAAGTVPIGSWIHVAGVYDPSDLSMKIYLNGLLTPTTMVNTVPSSMYNPPSISVAIGTRSDGTTRWDGKLDEVRLYDEALNADQIMALVPEPATLTLGLALAAMFGLRRFMRVS
jgi:hypothetical protein